jgi:hypothetical protein
VSSGGGNLALWCQRHFDFRDVLGSGGSRDWKATAKRRRKRAAVAVELLGVDEERSTVSFRR